MRKGKISIWVVCFSVIAFAVVVNRPTAPVPINSELELEGSGIYDNDYYVGEQNQILIVRILDIDGGGDITNFWCNITTNDPAINFTDNSGNIGDLPYDSTPGPDDYLWDPSVTWNYFTFTFDVNNSATPGEHYVILKLNYTNSAAVRRMDVIFGIKIIIGPFTKTLYVGGTGVGNYTHIQYAIENASDGDTVFVFDDSAPYYENVVVDKTINLIGENRDTTIIDGGGSGNVICITADWVNVTGFTITNNGGSYYWDAGILVDSTHNNISGNIVLSNQRTGIYIGYCNWNILLDNIVLNNSYGIFLKSSNYNIIFGNNITNDDIILSNSNGNFIAYNNISNNWKSGLSFSSSNDNTIIGNKINSNGEYGIDIYNSSNNNLTANEMIDNGIYIMSYYIDGWNTHTIDTSNVVNGRSIYYWKNRIGGIIPSEAGQVILANCTNVTVKNQELTNASLGLILGFSNKNQIMENNITFNNYGIYSCYSNNNTITNNTIAFNNWRGFYISRSYENNIANNNVSNSIEGIHISFSNGNNIINNIISNNRNGILLDTSCQNNIKGNVVMQNWEDGIFLTDSYNNNIIENSVHSNDDYGIILFDTYNNSIMNNNASDNYDGISIWRSSHNIVVNNTAQNNTDGIHIHDSSENNIVGNTFSFNKKFGISIVFSEWNNITNNMVFSNDFGIGLCESFYNSIYHNNFISNTNQTNCDIWSDYNLWDNGYPHGGNYWSDYTGVDEHSGPNQDQPGSDGIGDTPYIIDSDSQDNYPLIVPWVIDDSPPTIELVSPSNNSVIRPGKNIKLSISDPHLDEVLYSLNSGADQVLDFPFEINTTEWKDGNCIIQIYSADFYNNTNITWFNFTIDSISPSIALISPGNNSIIQRGTFLNFSIIDINLLHVNYSFNGGSNTSLSEPFNISTTSWPDGEYTIQINALDKAGNKDSKWYFFTIDSTPPDIAEVMITLFPMESCCYVNMSVNASDSTQIYNIWVNITDPYGITIGNFSMNYDSIRDLYYINQTCEFFGEYQLVIWANDTVGNWISNTGYFDVFTLPGAPTNLTATDGEGYIVITWCAPVSNGGSPITIYRIYRGKISSNETYLTVVYNSSHYIDMDIIEGETYYYKVRAETFIGTGPQSDEVSAACNATLLQDKDEGLPWWLWVIITVVIALIIIFIIYMIFSKKKKQQPPPQLQYPSESQLIERKTP